MKEHIRDPQALALSAIRTLARQRRVLTDGDLVQALRTDVARADRAAAFGKATAGRILLAGHGHRFHSLVYGT